jgi:hypothetical protein
VRADAAGHAAYNSRSAIARPSYSDYYCTYSAQQRYLDDGLLAGPSRPLEYVTFTRKGKQLEARAPQPHITKQGRAKLSLMLCTRAATQTIDAATRDSGDDQPRDHRNQSQEATCQLKAAFFGVRTWLKQGAASRPPPSLAFATLPPPAGKSARGGQKIWAEAGSGQIDALHSLPLGCYASFAKHSI